MVAQAVYVPPEPDILDWKLAEKSLRHFIRQAWHVIEPFTPFVDNWHIGAVCEHLESVAAGQIRNLLVTFPPRMMKSITCSVMFPAWVWVRRPEARFLYSSYAQSLATDHSLATRRVIESDWYQERWGDRFSLAGDANLKTRFENDKRGYRFATGVGGSATGHGGNFVVVDDPHNVSEGESDAVRTSTVEWWNRTMSTRLNDPKRDARIVVMQRVHAEDVAGDVLDQGGYDHLNLPMEYEPTTRVTAIGWRDPRTEAGELLAPARMGASEVAQKKRELGSYAYAGQYQQRPSPAEGGILRRVWWRFWHVPGQPRPPVRVPTEHGLVECPAVPLPYAFDEDVQSWDMAFKGDEPRRAGRGRERSYVVGQVGSRLGADLFVRDQLRDHLDFPGTIDGLLSLSRAWPTTGAKYVEDKANGPAVIDTLRGKVPGLIAVGPQGDKTARARAASPFIESGNVYLPHPQIAGWVDGLIEEAASYPNGKATDQVDALTQMVMRTIAQHVGTGALDEAFGRSTAWQSDGR